MMKIKNIRFYYLEILKVDECQEEYYYTVLPSPN